MKSNKVALLAFLVLVTAFGAGYFLRQQQGPAPQPAVAPEAKVPGIPVR